VNVSEWYAPEIGAGALVAAGILLAWLVVRGAPRLRGPAAVGGVTVAVAAGAGIGILYSLPGGIVVALLLAAMGQWRVVRAAMGRAAVLCPFLAGMVVLADDDLPDLPWFRVLVLIAVTCGAPLAAACDDLWSDEALGPCMLALTVLGVYAAAPDTEDAAVLLGACLPVALLGWPLRVVRLGRMGAAAAVTLVVWVAAVGSRGRPASLIGCVACLGLLAGLPLGMSVARTVRIRLPRRHPPRPAVLAAAVLGAQAALVVAAARAAGLRESPWGALAVACVVGIAAVLVGAGIEAMWRVRPRATVPR
jgi:hypothetical protein